MSNPQPMPPAPSGSPAATAKATPALPPISGGQRASAILAGIVGHILFAIGWFGIAFILLGPLVSGLVNDLLGNLVGDGDAQQLTSILQRAGALIWLLGLVFFVGSLAFVVFGVLSSLVILRRGSVDKPGRVNWTSFVIAAVVDLPIFLLVLWIATLVTDDSAGLLWLPPVLGLLFGAAIGTAVWWCMAHVNRGPVPPKPPKHGKAPAASA